MCGVEAETHRAGRGSSPPSDARQLSESTVQAAGLLPRLLRRRHVGVIITSYLLYSRRYLSCGTGEGHSEKKKQHARSFRLKQHAVRVRAQLRASHEG